MRFVTGTPNVSHEVCPRLVLRNRARRPARARASRSREPPAELRPSVRPFGGVRRPAPSARPFAAWHAFAADIDRAWTPGFRPRKHGTRRHCEGGAVLA